MSDTCTFVHRWVWLLWSHEDGTPPEVGGFQPA
jgi:hypothetical protein